MTEETTEETFQPRYSRLVWRMHGDVPHLELDSIPLQEGEHLLVSTPYGFSCLVEICTKKVNGYEVYYFSRVYGAHLHSEVVRDIAIASVDLMEGRLCSRDLPKTYVKAGVNWTNQLT